MPIVKTNGKKVKLADGSTLIVKTERDMLIEKALENYEGQKKLADASVESFWGVPLTENEEKKEELLEILDQNPDN